MLSDQRAFAADRLEGRAFLHRADAQAEQGQRAADIESEQDEDEGAALRIDGEGVDAGEDARADQEGADHRHREGDHGEHDRPGAQAVAGGEHGDAEWSKAVAASQGISEAFSTGSQNHQPPQPSS